MRTRTGNSNTWPSSCHPLTWSLRPTEKVTPGTPASLPPLPEGAPANRLGLAQWATMPDHPLTARVAVNRFWQMLFGMGIVKTTADFGAQGEWPSHPELLDWLAVDFVESGWDVKALVRQIVTSATYRQTSAASEELLARDPENRLLARGPRFRLPAEFIRDAALKIERAAGRPHRRPERQSLHAGRPVARDQPLRQFAGDGAGVHAGPWREALPPVALHLLEADRAAAEHGGVRCAEPRDLHGAAGVDHHAAAGAGAAERRAVRRGGRALGRADAASTAATTRRGCGGAFEECTSRPPTDEEFVVLAGR